MRKHDLSVYYTDPNRLILHPDNPRRGNLEELKRSLETNGQYKPVVVNGKSGYVVAGNHTVRAAQELGWTEIAYLQLHVDRTTELRILAVDNRIGDLGEYDNDALLAVLDELNGDLLGTGYTEVDLEVLRHRDDEDPEPEPEDDAEPGFVVYGAVIQCGTLEDQRSLLAKLSELGFDARPLKRD